MYMLQQTIYDIFMTHKKIIFLQYNVINFHNLFNGITLRSCGKHCPKHSGFQIEYFKSKRIT